MNGMQDDCTSGPNRRRVFAWPGGVRDGFHVASHHSNNRANMGRCAPIDRFHVETLASFLDKLKATPDGNGTGGAAGQLKGGRHRQYATHTPMSNLLLAMLDKLEIQAERHGDSTGKLEI